MLEALYGEWASPITAKVLATASVRLGDIALDGGCAYWLEGRPAEGGCNILVCCDENGIREATVPPFNVRTRVHEYGGGAFLVDCGRVWFVNFDDQRIYHTDAATPPIPLTQDGPWRYADMALDADRGRLVCVREEHFEDGRVPDNTLVAVELADGTVRVLAEGHDFFSSPRLSNNGKRLAWLTWDHPDMPWDATTLWVAEIGDDGALVAPQRIAGGNGESVFQPMFRDDGVLYFVSDPDGWWNLYCWDGGEAQSVFPMQAEFGRPQWQFGMSTYGFDSEEGIVCCYSRAGVWQLARCDAAGGKLEDIDTEFTDIQAIAVKRGRALIVGGGATRTESVVLIDLASGSSSVLCESMSRKFAEKYVSAPEAIEFPTGNGESAHAFYYPPRNPDYRAPDDARPPLMVICHDGPTGATSATLSLRVQFWTSRGFGVLDVNYRGSTGYGRAYRERLKGGWGLVDVDDCINGARFVVNSGRADGDRLLIRGSSAGGFTTLVALTFHDDFRAGASYYGVSDLETLTQDTHKFESHYLDRLIGPYPEARDHYIERSPIHAVDRLSCPIIFFQGLEDEVVPPSQAKQMVEALRAKGLPVAYLEFEGEQHGFCKADTIERTLQTELCFYARVLGFDPADILPELVIDNL